MKIITDPIHHQILLNKNEQKLINSKLFRRLNDIKHLGFAYKVFPAATHSRYSHSLGVAHLCGVIFRITFQKYKSRDLRNLPKIEKKKFVKVLEKIGKKIRVAGFLHDLGQGPFSHIAERISGYSHEAASSKFVLNDKELKSILFWNFGFDEEDLIDISFIIQGKREITKKYEELLGQNCEFIIEILNGPLDADKIDYLRRDSYFTGMHFGEIEYNLYINNLILKNGRLSIQNGGIHAAEMMMVSRYKMYEAVYFNRFVRARETAITEAFKLLYANDLMDNINNYDYKIIEDIPNIPKIFYLTDTNLKSFANDLRRAPSKQIIINDLSESQQFLINYCINQFLDIPIARNEHFELIYDGKLESIKDGFIRKEILQATREKEFEEIRKLIKKRIIEFNLESIEEDLILVDLAKFTPYGIKPENLADEPIILMEDEAPRKLSEVSEIAKSLKTIPIENLRIFIAKLTKKDLYEIKKRISEIFGESFIQ